MPPVLSKFEHSSVQKLLINMMRKPLDDPLEENRHPTWLWMHQP